METRTYEVANARGTVKLEFSGQLVTHVCPSCAIVHAIPAELNQRALDHPGPTGAVYCPNGHAWYYTGPTPATRQRERAEAAERELEITRHQRDAARVDEAAARARETKALRSARSIRAHRDRVLRLLAAGVCPVAKCGRDLGDAVREHVRTEHYAFHAHYLAAPEA